MYMYMQTRLLHEHVQYLLIWCPRERGVREGEREMERAGALSEGGTLTDDLQGGQEGCGKGSRGKAATVVNIINC